MPAWGSHTEAPVVSLIGACLIFSRLVSLWSHVQALHQPWEGCQLF